MTLISVVIPAYNNAEYIEETLDSVLTQTYENLEIIVSDHASTDGTLSLLHKYSSDPRVKLYSTEAGGGAPRNWNRVSQLATGEYIRLVCGDDVLEPTSIERHAEALSNNPGAGMAASPRKIINGQGEVLFKSRGLSGLKGLVSGHKAIRATVLSGSNIFGEPACVTFRKSALEQAGWWHENAQYLLDQTTYTEVLLLNDLVAVPETLASFRVSSSQWSYRLATEQSKQVCEYHVALKNNHPEVLSNLDVFRGNTMARLNATARRIIYLLMKRN